MGTFPTDRHVIHIQLLIHLKTMGNKYIQTKLILTIILSINVVYMEFYLFQTHSKVVLKFLFLFLCYALKYAINQPNVAKL